MGVKEQLEAGSRKQEAFRRWLFRLCQSRSGQCLQTPPKKSEPTL